MPAVGSSSRTISGPAASTKWSQPSTPRSVRTPRRGAPSFIKVAKVMPLGGSIALCIAARACAAARDCAAAGVMLAAPAAAAAPASAVVLRNVLRSCFMSPSFVRPSRVALGARMLPERESFEQAGAGHSVTLALTG